MFVGADVGKSDAAIAAVEACISDVIPFVSIEGLYMEHECDRQRWELAATSAGFYGIVDLSCDSIVPWLERLKPRHYVTAPILSVPTLNGMEDTLREFEFLVEDSLIVNCATTEVAEAAGRADWIVGLDLSVKGPLATPWHLCGRVVLMGGDRFLQWYRFCELSSLGVDIVGVILGRDWWTEANRHRYIKTNLYDTAGQPGLDFNGLAARSIYNLSMFFRAANNDD